MATGLTILAAAPESLRLELRAIIFDMETSATWLDQMGETEARDILLEAVKGLEDRADAHPA